MGHVTQYSAEETEIIYQAALAGMGPKAIARALAEKGYDRIPSTVGNAKAYREGSFERRAAERAGPVEVEAPAETPRKAPSLPFRTITKTFEGHPIPPVSVARFSFDEMAA